MEINIFDLIKKVRTDWTFFPSGRHKTIFDIDGTLAETYRKLCDELGFSYKSTTNYLGRTPEEAIRIRAWFNEPGSYIGLPVKLPVAELYEAIALKGITPQFLTARPATIADITLDWLSDNLVGWKFANSRERREKVNVTFTRADFNERDLYLTQSGLAKEELFQLTAVSKAHHLEKLLDDDYYLTVFEDDDITARRMAELGGKVKVYLIDTPYNQPTLEQAQREIALGVTRILGA